MGAIGGFSTRRARRGARAGLLGALALFALDAAAVPIPGLYDTGVDDFGSVLALGTSDPHFVLTGPVTPAIVISRVGAWVGAPAGAAWIGPSNGNVTDPPGNYSYRLTIDLTGLDATTALVSGRLSSDNVATIAVNSVDSGFSNAGIQFNALTNFSLSGSFVSGINVIDFVVNNGAGSSGNPTGLLIAGLTGSADAAPVPEPATVALVACALLLAGWRRRVPR